MNKRNLFEELKQGIDEIQGSEDKKITLKTHHVETPEPLQVTAEEILALRKQLNLSRAVFANYLRIKLRTLEKWEHGYSKPNDQAAVLIKMVETYPDTIKRLAKL